MRTFSRCVRRSSAWTIVMLKLQLLPTKCSLPFSLLHGRSASKWASLLDEPGTGTAAQRCSTHKLQTERQQIPTFCIHCCRRWQKPSRMLPRTRHLAGSRRTRRQTSPPPLQVCSCPIRAVRAAGACNCCKAPVLLPPGIQARNKCMTHTRHCFTGYDRVTRKPGLSAKSSLTG